MATNSSIQPTIPYSFQKNWHEEGFLPNNHTPHAEILMPLGHTPRVPVLEKYLPVRALLLLKGNHSGEKVTSLHGIIWITQSGNPEDIFLCAGETFEITRKGPIVIQSMAEARLKINAAYEPSALGAAFGRAVHQITGVLSHFL